METTGPNSVAQMSELLSQLSVAPSPNDAAHAPEEDIGAAEDNATSDATVSEEKAATNGRVFSVENSEDEDDNSSRDSDAGTQRSLPKGLLERYFSDLILGGDPHNHLFIVQNLRTFKSTAVKELRKWANACPDDSEGKTKLHLLETADDVEQDMLILALSLQNFYNQRQVELSIKAEEEMRDYRRTIYQLATIQTGMLDLAIPPVREYDRAGHPAFGGLTKILEQGEAFSQVFVEKYRDAGEEANDEKAEDEEGMNNGEEMA